MDADELQARMREVFRRELEAERAEVATRDTATVRIRAILGEFPELNEEQVAELALRELYYGGDWVPTETPLPNAQGGILGVWFTDRAGARRLGLR